MIYVIAALNVTQHQFELILFFIWLISCIMQFIWWWHHGMKTPMTWKNKHQFFKHDCCLSYLQQWSHCTQFRDLKWMFSIKLPRDSHNLQGSVISWKCCVHNCHFVREIPHKGPVIWSFDHLFVVIMYKLLNKQFSCRLKLLSAHVMSPWHKNSPKLDFYFCAC